MGKVLYVASLVPESRYYTSELIRVNNLSDDPNANVLVTKKLRKQLEFWILLIKLVGEGMPILRRRKLSARLMHGRRILTRQAVHCRETRAVA